MNSKKMLFIAEKESFITRVLIKKAEDTGVSCGFARSTINDIHEALPEVALVTLYMEHGAKPREDFLHYLSDNLEENGVRIIVIGEPDDVRYLYDNLPGEVIYQTFSRPVDNAQFQEAITVYFEKLNAGDYKRKILIVDDDSQYLSLVRQWLKDTYKVYMANSGLQAIKLLGKNKVDLILLDHEMPVTTGPQVLEMLRSDPETSNIPVMFLTGKSDKQSVMAVVALKPEGYFLKTIQKEELLEKLGEFFVLRR